MTAQEWMDKHGLKWGDKAKIARLDDPAINHLIGCEVFLVAPGGTSEELVVDVCIGGPGLVRGEIEVSKLELTPQISDPKYADSPFPTLAEFLS